MEGPVASSSTQRGLISIPVIVRSPSVNPPASGTPAADSQKLDVGIAAGGLLRSASACGVTRARGCRPGTAARRPANHRDYGLSFGRKPSVHVFFNVHGGDGEHHYKTGEHHVHHGIIFRYSRHIFPTAPRLSDEPSSRSPGQPGHVPAFLSCLRQGCLPNV